MLTLYRTHEPKFTKWYYFVSPHVAENKAWQISEKNDCLISWEKVTTNENYDLEDCIIQALCDNTPLWWRETVLGYYDSGKLRESEIDG